jgi:uncharacterized YccA/Bax inhibitor family protein
LFYDRCNENRPVRSGDFGLVLFAFRKLPASAFVWQACLGTFGVSIFLLLFYRCIYLSTLFDNIGSLVEFGVHNFLGFT